jgi:TldD protein
VPVSRRYFLRVGAIVTAGAALPGAALSARWPGPEARWPLRSAAVKELALRAIEAARAAGATYADARLSRSQSREVRSNAFPGWGEADTGTSINVGEVLAIGVRALVNGCWGFASSAVWSPDEAARLGRVAVAQAKAGAIAGLGTVELHPVPVVRDGHWVTPVEIDPFTVSMAEMTDIVESPAFFSLLKWRTVRTNCSVLVTRRETAFASSEGAYATQVLIATSGGVSVGLRPDGSPGSEAVLVSGEGAGSDMLPLAGRGWEYVARAPFQDEMERLIEEYEEDRRLPERPVEVGRRDVVFDAATTAQLLDGTLGLATELDRAMGYEANARGTSYLDDPLAMLGREQVAMPFITVTGDRSMPAGAATVKWDDEGVEPQDFTLVEDGVLVDFQTTRESAAWLREAYAREGRGTPRSRGCAGAASALEAPQLQPPNLHLAPGAQRQGFDDLVAGLADGVAVKRGYVAPDFNALNGMVLNGGSTHFAEVKRGKRVSRFAPTKTAVIFRAPELWKGVLTLGGPESVRITALPRLKGEPLQVSTHTVGAPPMAVRQLAIIDPGQ